MALTSLKESLSSKPLVLAGPILRQVTDSKVTVWLALRSKATVTLSILDQNQHPVMEGTANTTPVGVSLHIVAVTATPLLPFDGLKENVVYQYTILFGDILDLRSATRSARLTYPPYDNPSFCLPPKNLNKLRLFHGSCRKPHAEGKDALRLLDGLIAAKASSPYERPHQLILTGDQIYADDVADVLLLLLNDAGKVLLGWQETLDTTPLRSPIPFQDWPSYYRLAILSDAKFTSDDLKSHLATLGEFFSMYLFVWSDVLWPDALPTFDDVISRVTGFTRSTTRDRVIKYLNNHKKTINNERDNVTTFKSALADVRCALANIPTYMICDDHEVTDDWNMTLRFCQQVYETPVGIRIVQNALVAFSICQAWGNAPERFAVNTAGAALLEKLTDVSSGKAYDVVSQQIQPIVGIHPSAVITTSGGVYHDGEDNLPSGSVNSQSLRFNFRIEGSGHVIVVTDTRTWRAFSSLDGRPVLLPTLVRPEMTRQFDFPLQGFPPDDRLLLVVVTTNAPPIASVRFAASRPAMVDLGTNPGPNIWQLMKDIFWSDTEGLWEHHEAQERRAVFKYELYDSWEFPSKSYDELVTKLDSLLQSRNSQQVILLSGDVHSSFSSRLTVFAKQGGSFTPRLVVAQLVSSPFKNQEYKTRGQQLEGYEYGPGWIARKLVPSFVPESFNGPTLGGSISTKYRLDYLVTVPGASSPQPNPLLIKDGEDVANLWNYKYAGQEGRTLTYTNPGPLQIIGHNNIAELTFLWGPDKRARHTLHWIGPNEKTFATTYDVSLNPADSAFGPLP